MIDASINDNTKGHIVRYAYIDALRGIAILAVIFGHCYPLVYGIPDWLKAYGAQGGRGVQLFFIISALTLFFSFETRKEFERRALLNYFIRRFFRIAPLFYTGIIFYLVLDGTSPRYWAPQGISLAHIFSTVIFLNAWHPSAFNSVVPGGWSIAVEAMFYFVLPICFHKIKNVHSAAWFVFATLLLSLLCKEYTVLFLTHFSEHPRYLIGTFTDLWFPSQLPVFSLGFVLHFMIRSLQKERPTGKAEQTRALLYSSIAVFLIMVLPFESSKFIPHFYKYGLAFVMLAYSLSIYPQKLWVNSVTCYIGKISFSCYIFHFVCIRIIRRIFSHTNLLYLPDFPPTIQILFYYFSVLFLTIIIAHFSYKYIETYGMNIGKRLINKIENSHR